MMNGMQVPTMSEDREGSRHCISALAMTAELILMIPAPEFPTLLEEEWNVPLKMSVDFTTAKKTSEETSLEIPDDNAGVASETENTETKEAGKEES